MYQPLHKTVRSTLAARIAGGELRPGDRLPGERDLSAEFDVARSVIRQALAGLARDGMIVSAYPRGYDVLGPASLGSAASDFSPTNPGTSRSSTPPSDPRRPTTSPPSAWTPTTPSSSAPSRSAARSTHQPWALALATYPLDAFNDETRTLLLDSGFIDDDELERVSGRRLVGYHERISARLPTPDEADRLDLPPAEPVLTLTRTARTTTTPISRLSITARTDRLEVDYLIEP